MILPMIQFILRGDVKKRGSFGWYVPQMGVEGSMARPHLGQKTNTFCFASLQIFKTVLSYLGDFGGRLSSWIYEKISILELHNYFLMSG